MGYVAKGSIALNSVNDAYSVSLSRSSCSLAADANGAVSDFTGAQTTIRVFRGSKSVEFDCVLSDNTYATLEGTASRTSYTLQIIGVPANAAQGSVSATVTTDDGYSTEVIFSYSVMKETSMLDWIRDWDSGKTKIGGTYIMTPKLFIGKKDNFADYAEGGDKAVGSITSVPGLTGVYIGPDTDSTGIYGYKNSQEIFHLNNDGGMIGGWSINETGIYSQAGMMSILSTGSIAAKDANGNDLWAVHEDGSAMFARENVKFYANGDAEFNGKIQSAEGDIGSWDINTVAIYKENICMSAAERAIAVLASGKYKEGTDVLPKIRLLGGVALHCTSSTDWGIIGYNGETNIFALGSSNLIASWQFDDKALWSGTKNNNAGTYTTDGITIGSNGLRGQHWFIDTDGSISFLDGKIMFSSESKDGTIVGWKLNEKRFSTSNVAIISDSDYAGIYMSTSSDVDFNTVQSNAISNTIQEKGGMYMAIQSNEAMFAAYDQSQQKVFGLSNGNGLIAGWNFDSSAIYTGVKNTTTGSFTANTDSITISNSGIRANKWRLEGDGSGSLAADNIRWDTTGKLTLQNIDFEPTLTTSTSLSDYYKKFRFTRVRNVTNIFDEQFLAMAAANGGRIEDNDEIVNVVFSANYASDESFYVQFSSDNADWHDGYKDTDQYMLVKSGGEIYTGKSMRLDSSTIDDGTETFYQVHFALYEYETSPQVGGPEYADFIYDYPPTPTKEKPYVWAYFTTFTGFNSRSLAMVNSTGFHLKSYAPTGEADIGELKPAGLAEVDTNRIMLYGNTLDDATYRNTANGVYLCVDRLHRNSLILLGRMFYIDENGYLKTDEAGRAAYRNWDESDWSDPVIAYK